MPPKSRDKTPPSALEIKAGSITLPIVRLFTSDPEALGPQLEEKLRRAPEFFRHAPVILDLAELTSGRESPDFSAIAALMRSLNLIPVGVRGGSPSLHQAAQAAQLAVLAEHKPETVAEPPVPEPSPKVPAATTPAGTTRLVKQPVRSGQRIYAQDGDLIVMSQISPGAEVMADGHIHIYGPLRGRALAGVQGNLDARIFCFDLQAELVGIGGHYKVSEQLDDAFRGKAVQIYLRDNSLIIDPL